jgi:hypothetical protein
MIELMTQAQIDADRPAWLAKRRELITGTDIALIAGADPDHGPVSVYHDKVTGISRADSWAMLLGRVDEQALAEVYAGLHPDIHPGYLPAGQELHQLGLCVHEDRLWQGATLDRVRLPDGVVVEFKTSVKRGEFGEPPHGDLPLRSLIQALWEGTVTGAPLVEVVVLLRPFGPFWRFFVPMTGDVLEDAAFFTSRAAEFRERYLLPRVAPPADWRPGTTDALKRLYRHVEDAERVVVPKRLHVAALRAAQRRRDAENAERAARNAIAELQGDAAWSVLRDGTRVMQRSPSWPRRVNLDLLRSRYPDIADECTYQPDEGCPEVRWLLKGGSL